LAIERVRHFMRYVTLTPNGGSPYGDRSYASSEHLKGVSQMAKASKFTNEQVQCNCLNKEGHI